MSNLPQAHRVAVLFLQQDLCVAAETGLQALCWGGEIMSDDQMRVIYFTCPSGKGPVHGVWKGEVKLGR